MAGLIPYNHRRNYLIPRNPFSMMDDFFGEAWPLGRTQMTDTFKVDVQESEEAYTIEAELPGAQKEDVKLSLEEGRLPIGVERSEESQNETDHYIHRERHYTSARRSLYMSEADSDGVSASLADGILKIIVPKRKKAEGTNQIEIH